jgi:hypothetical protein
MAPAPVEAVQRYCYLRWEVLALGRTLGGPMLALAQLSAEEVVPGGGQWVLRVHEDLGGVVQVLGQQEGVDH